ncbi:MAG: hypothetical protein ACTHMW_16090, partial [Actinomycetes bacterium]
MASDLKAYLQLLSGLTEVTKQQAMGAARSLLSSGPLSSLGQEVSPQALRDQVAGLAAEISASGRANRDLLVGLISAEVERVVTRLGLVSGGELQSVEAEVDRLASRVRRLEAQANASGSGAAGSSGAGAEGVDDVWSQAVAAQGDAPSAGSAPAGP